MKMAEVYYSTYGKRSVNGQWVNVANRYLGLKFLIKGKIHYGWARLSVKVQGHAITATLTGYAYETIPNKYFFYGKGDGTFGTAIAIADTINNQGGFSIASGDFNNDKAPDLAIPIEQYGKVAILLNTQ
jgi:hypothetical protein